MITKKIKIIILFISTIYSNDIDNVKNILNRYIHNFDHIDMSMDVELQDIDGKIDKRLRYMVLWPKHNSSVKMIRVDVLLPEKLNKLTYWEHHSIDSDISRWITVPRNGKIKKIKSGNLLAKQFSTTKIDISNFIDTTTTFSLSPIDTLDSPNHCLVDMVSEIKKIRASALLDTSLFIIKKIDLFNIRGIHTHRYSFSDFIVFNEKNIPMKCVAEDIKNKKVQSIIVSNLSSSLAPDSLFMYPDK